MRKTVNEVLISTMATPSLEPIELSQMLKLYRCVIKILKCF